MKNLSRRTLLRGVLAGSAIGVGIPILECMGRGRGEAFAQSLNPSCFGVFFWGGGLPWTKLSDRQARDADVDIYTPPGEPGTSELRMTELLAPLAASRDWLNVVTGLGTEKHSRVIHRESHYSGQTIALTGDGVAYIDRSDLIYGYSRPSIDRVVAQHPDFYKEPPRKESVHICAIDRFFKQHSGWNAISMDGTDRPVKPVVDPRLLYGQLFGGFTAETDSKEKRHLQSALDAVMADAKSLQSRLGQADRLRLEHHLDALRGIESRLAAPPLTCSIPAEPGDDPDLLKRFDLQAEILVAALRCGITRVFSFMVSGGAHGLKLSGDGVQDGPGSTNNHGALHAGVRAAAVGNAIFSFRALQSLLGRLAIETTATGAPLLDNTVIYATSEYGTGWHHGHAEFPVLIAGKGGGRLRAGNHVRLPRGNICDAQLTVLRALGLNVESWGWNGGETTSALPGLLA